MNEFYKNEIQRLSLSLESLLTAKAIKYSNWNQYETRNNLRQQAGVYHFYEIQNEQVISLYVGKAGLGSKGNWSLFKRISQHFQVSQKNTILGKYSKHNKISMEYAKAQLEQANLYLQYFSIEEPQSVDLDRELMKLECFCKSILNPKFTVQ